jgi:hypothetical protein
MEYHEIIDGLRAVRSWNGFAQSLLQQYDRYGRLSERQYDAAERVLLKCTNLEQRKKAETVAVDVTRIELLLQTAVMGGLRYPKFRAEGLTFSLASPGTKNAGAVYVKKGEDYVGKIMGGMFRPVSDTPDGTGAAIARIASDPRGAAVQHGRITGNCACCGRQLTDPKSVELGIGPICAERWGL